MPGFASRMMLIAAVSLAICAPIASQAGSTKPKKPVLATEAPGEQMGGEQMEGGQTQMPQPDSITTYDQSRLQSLDSQTKTKMQNQQQGNAAAGADLQMIQIQSLQSQRQNAITTTNQMIQGTQCQKCVGNIGN